MGSPLYGNVEALLPLPIRFVSASEIHMYDSILPLGGVYHLIAPTRTYVCK